MSAKVNERVLSERAVQFLESMPAAYRNAFSDSDVEEHAQIAQQRGSDLAQAVVWRTLPQGLAILCVVTEDRPGLVALVSSAFLAHALDVRSAQIYCRTHPAGVDAVDFFWLRNVGGGAPEPSRLEACTRTIRELLESASAAPELAPVAEIVRSSHERWDGAGYPDGLAAQDIPLGARIVAVCDSWEAMTSSRAYRAAMSPTLALNEITRCSGSQFDPRVVAAFLAVRQAASGVDAVTGTTSAATSARIS